MECLLDVAALVRPNALSSVVLGVTGDVGVKVRKLDNRLASAADRGDSFVANVDALSVLLWLLRIVGALGPLAVIEEAGERMEVGRAVVPDGRLYDKAVSVALGAGADAGNRGDGRCFCRCSTSVL